MTVESNNFFRNVEKHPDRFYIIHYSSQSLYDEGVDGFSPRITSIVVMHYATRQTASFALHAVAESLDIPKDQVESHYGAIESVLLERFFGFLRDRREKYWVHWNMRNLTFGFEHLEHRYRLLCKSRTPKRSCRSPTESQRHIEAALRLRLCQRPQDEKPYAPEWRNR